MLFLFFSEMIIMKYGVIYCFYNDENVIKNVELINAKSIEDAFNKTDCNIEINTIIPLNRHNKKMLRKLLN